MGVNRTFSSYINPDFMAMLPRDIHREILELAAFLYPRFAVRMSTASKELQQWAERIIYHDLYFNPEQRWRSGNNESIFTKFQIVLQARSTEFFESHVRALHFEGEFSAANILSVLRRCKGVTNLGLYAKLESGSESTGQIYEAVAQLPLQTLFISKTHLSTLGGYVSGSNSSLRSVTHLGLVDGWEYSKNLFPELTHLAIVPDYQHAAAFVEYVRGILQNMSIRSVVATHPFVNARDHFEVVQGLMDITDDRLVLFTLPGSMTRYIEDDLWDLAHTFPDENQGLTLTYLEGIPEPKILTFEEMMAVEAARSSA